MSKDGKKKGDYSTHPGVKTNTPFADLSKKLEEVKTQATKEAKEKGLSPGKTHKKILSAMARQLEDVLGGIEGMDPKTARVDVQELRGRALEDAKTLIELEKVNAMYDRELPEDWEKNPTFADSELGKDAKRVRGVIAKIKAINPFAVEAAKTMRREYAKGKVDDLRGEATKGYTLHKACNGEPGTLALRIQYEYRETHKTRTVWLALKIEDKIAVPLKGTAGGFLVKNTEPFALEAPDFRNVKPALIGKGLREYYAFEEKIIKREATIQEILTKREITLAEAFAGKEGVFAAHHRDWSNTKTGRRGSVTIAGKATGGALILLEYFVPYNHIGFDGVYNKELPLNLREIEKVDKEFAKFLKYRLGYEKKMAERNEEKKAEVVEVSAETLEIETKEVEAEVKTETPEIKAPETPEVTETPEKEAEVETTTDA